jgi:3-phenylpropionate/trans-cinnamate dioxygenase ferredoxin component
MERERSTVGKASDVGEGEIRGYVAGSREVAVAYTSGAWHAFDNICTHMQCTLSEGELEGTRIECPCHGSAFDVTSGQVLNGPATEPVNTFEVRLEGEDIQVAV